MSKVSGFKLSGSKRKKIIDASDDASVLKEEIKSIEGNVVHSLVEKKEKVELVIPLAAPLNPNGVYMSTKHTAESVKKILNSSTTDATKKEVKSKSIEELAEEEILNDLSGKAKGEAAPLVIKAMPDVGTGESTDNGNDGKVSNGVMKKAPLLMANIAPELFGIEDDGERFKLDVDLRADNLDVTSESYVSVPIADFGAAMLRGMGWSGPSKEDAEKDTFSVTPRDYRLGLGATPKPPDESTRGKSKKDKEKEKNKWQKRAEEQLAKQILQVGSLVWLRDPSMVGKRAEVVAISGVPGLNKIRVTLEKSGEQVDVSKLEVVLLTEEELDAAPFVFPVEPSGRVGERRKRKDRDRDRDRLDRGRSEVEESSRSGDKRNRVSDDGDRWCLKDRERDRDRRRDRDKDRHHKDRERNHDREKDRYGDRERDRERAGHESSAASDKISKHSMEKNNDDEGLPSGWLRAGIRVKIISKKVGGGKYYLQKGRVVDVFFSSSNSNSKVASIRMDSNGSSQEAKEKHLETVLPSEGGMCMILAGEHEGYTATLMQKNHKRNTVSVQLVDDMEVVTVSMDGVAAVS